MEYKKVKQYQTMIAAILFIFLIFIPTSKVITAMFLWIIIFIISNQFCNNFIFSLFISSLFIILYLIFNNKKKIEGFEADNPHVVENPQETDTDPIIEPVDEPVAEPVVEPVAEPVAEPVVKRVQQKISMMDDVKNDEKDVFDLDTGAFEDSDEDSDKDEKEENFAVGSSSVSSKQAYKAQKQLYDLTVATSKLSQQMDKLSGPLKQGQKIIETMNSLGLNKFI